jgi:hypothetical protein
VRWRQRRAPFVGAEGGRQSAFPEQALEGGEGKVFARGLERFAQQQIARGVVGDGQRVAVGLVAKPELALVVGAPEVIRGLA